MEEVKLPEPDTASLAYSGHSMDYISGYEAGFESAADQVREAILKEREQADEDAKRYRWLREHAYIELECDSPRLSGFTNDGFDAAVDAAAFRKG